MRHRQKIWPKILLTIIFWLGFFYLVFSTSPDTSYQLSVISYQLKLPIAKIAFFIILLLSLTMTLSLILKSTKRALILSFALVTFLFLKMLQASNWLTLLLLIILTAVMLLA